MTSVEATYRDRAAAHAVRRDHLEQRSRLLSYARLATFTAFLGTLFWGLWIIDEPRPGFLGAAGGGPAQPRGRPGHLRAGLRDGVATSKNALKLVEIVGIDLED